MQKSFAIIGGTSGIGLATTRLLLAAGHSVHLVGRNEKAALELTPNFQFFDALTPSALAWPAKLDGLVYCPGTILLKPFARFTPADFQKDFQINVMGAVTVLQSALPALKASGSASVVLFSTVAANQGMPFHASIAASKGAVEGLGRTLAAEWAPIIRVNTIAPSLTNTPLAANLLNTDAKKEAMAKRNPLQLVGSPEDIAKYVELLLSDASKYMTGQTIHMDGGLSSIRI